MKKILFSLLLLTTLILSVSTVSAYHYHSDGYTYEKRVTNDYWGRTIEINRESRYSSLHYYKTTSPRYAIARTQNALGYIYPRHYYSNIYYSKTTRPYYDRGDYYHNSNYNNYYDRRDYYHSGYNSWRY